ACRTTGALANFHSLGRAAAAHGLSLRSRLCVGSRKGGSLLLAGESACPTLGRHNRLVDLSAFDYYLPDDLIAQQPLADRAASRMLVVHRAEGRWEDRGFRDLPQYLRPGDCLVLNDSRVFPARLFGHRTGVQSLPIGKR